MVWLPVPRKVDVQILERYGEEMAAVQRLQDRKVRTHTLAMSDSGQVGGGIHSGGQGFVGGRG